MKEVHYHVCCNYCWPIPWVRASYIGHMTLPNLAFHGTGGEQLRQHLTSIHFLDHNTTSLVTARCIMEEVYDPNDLITFEPFFSSFLNTAPKLRTNSVPVTALKKSLLRIILSMGQQILTRLQLPTVS